MIDLKFVRLDSRHVLRVSGPEAREFLQGLVSNDLARVSETRAIYAALLTPQGKYLHDFFIAELAGSFYLDCEAARIDDLFKRLRLFKLRTKIELEIVEDRAVAVLFGNGVHGAVAIQPAEGAATRWQDGLLYTDPRLSRIGVRAILPAATLQTTLGDAGFTATDFAEYDSLRLTLGLPDSSRDMAIDQSILLESGFEELNGVDFNKGCYVGQELTARTKYRGLIKKRLMPISFAGEPPPAGTELRQNNKIAGEMRSGISGHGIALVRLDALDNTQPMLAGDIAVTPNKPDWANF